MRDCPMHSPLGTADSQHGVVPKHGDEAMGFSLERRPIIFGWGRTEVRSKCLPIMLMTRQTWHDWFTPRISPRCFVTGTSRHRCSCKTGSARHDDDELLKSKDHSKIMAEIDDYQRCIELWVAMRYFPPSPPLRFTGLGQPQPQALNDPQSAEPFADEP